jgi:predicted MFS family arabinose efflux permease
MLIRRGVRADRTRSRPVLWAILFLVQVLFLAVPLANPSLWLLAALIWVTATPQSAQVRRPVEELIRRGR